MLCPFMSDRDNPVLCKTNCQLYLDGDCAIIKIAESLLSDK